LAALPNSPTLLNMQVILFHSKYDLSSFSLQYKFINSKCNSSYKHQQVCLQRTISCNCGGSSQFKHMMLVANGHFAVARTPCCQQQICTAATNSRWLHCTDTNTRKVKTLKQLNACNCNVKMHFS